MITEEAPQLQSSFGSAGAGPTAVSDAPRRQTTASLFSGTSARCHGQRLVAIGRTAYLRFVAAYDTASAPSTRWSTSAAPAGSVSALAPFFRLGDRLRPAELVHDDVVLLARHDVFELRVLMAGRHDEPVALPVGLVVVDDR